MLLQEAQRLQFFQGRILEGLRLHVKAQGSTESSQLGVLVRLTLVPLQLYEAFMPSLLPPLFTPKMVWQAGHNSYSPSSDFGDLCLVIRLLIKT